VLSVYWDGNVIWDNTEGRYHCTEMARHKLQRIKMNHEDFVLFIIIPIRTADSNEEKPQEMRWL